MDNLKRIERLFEHARQCATPVFHVGDRVLEDITVRQSVQLTPLSIVAGISAAAAVIALAYVVNSWLSMSGSLVDYFDPSVLDVLL